MHRGLNEGPPLDLDAGKPAPGVLFKDLMANSLQPSNTVVGEGPLQGFVVEMASDARTAVLRADDRYLSAVPGQAILDRDRLSAGAWETFIPLTAEDYADLCFLLDAEWVVASTQAIVRRGGVLAGYMLQIGELRADLRYNIPLLRSLRASGREADTLPRFWSATILVDGWRIETLHLFRPLIFYTAFRSVPALTQAFLSIGSLIEFGGYDGAVHVITDRAHHEFAREIPAINSASLTVQRVEAMDWTGFVAAKYCLLEWEPAWRHQPVVFLDADIVCDADLDPFLAAAATAGRLSAPAEEFSGLAHNPAVGADLLRRDGVDPGTRHGFNGGTLALPNLEQHGSAFTLIRTIIANHADLFGRSSFRWVDQETANYVGVRTGLVDTTALTPFVRYMGQGDEAVTDQRRGLAHFWVPRLDGMAKEDAMLRYVQALRSIQAGP